MSDFLDRLVTKTIGSEAMLAPRLPSLFEPLQRAPIMPLAEDGEAPVHRSDAVSKIPVMPTAPPAPSARAAEPMQRSAARVTPTDRTAAPKPAVALPRDVTQPSPVAITTVHPPAVEHAVPSPTPMRPPTACPPVVQPRQTRIAADRHEPLPPSSCGSLLPAPTPVFTTSRVAPAPVHSGRAVAMHARNAQAGSGNQTSSEPVVHVSIGRLEVRAAPVAAAPSRRRDGPQPGSLDDYLRQRGGKASP